MPNNTVRNLNLYILHLLAQPFVLQKTYRLNTRHTITFRHKNDRFFMPCQKWWLIRPAAYSYFNRSCLYI